MKHFGLTSVLAAISFLLPAIALGKQKDEGKLRLFDPVQIGSAQLKPGNYKVKWSGSGPGVVDFLKNNKIVATATGKVIELNRPPENDESVTSTTNDRRLKTLEEIDFRGRTEALKIEPSMTNYDNSMQRR